MLIALLAQAHAEDVICKACAGEKTADCKHCTTGEMPCPDRCLKRSTPGWHKMKVPGHADDELWMTFPTGASYNHKHIGEIIVVEQGKLVNKGRCPTCKGATVVACKRCSGAKKVPCAACGGDGRMDAQELKLHLERIAKEDQENTIQLKDGTAIKGRIMARMNGKAIIRKADKSMVEIDEKELKEDAGR